MNLRSRISYHLARLAGLVRPKRRTGSSMVPDATEWPQGISVVIPSRSGRHLLEQQLSGITRELEMFASEIIVVDNGSDDHTVEWLAREWPQIAVQSFADPLSFAAAVNCGIRHSRYSHVCLLNNDMLIEPGFFRALGEAFERVPDLFCATAQIRFPQGARREETGKAVMAQDTAEDFPIRCDVPLPGEDLSYVLYGSGGCSVYDAEKLQELGNLDETYAPAYVEDLDIGFRAWQRGWPTVFVAPALVEHRHRATTSRYYSAEELDTVLEINYLKFLSRAIADSKLFRRLWNEALYRLSLGADRNRAHRRALAAAPNIALAGGAASTPLYPEEDFLALTDGSVVVFPGHTPSGMPRALVAAAALGRRQRHAIPDMDQVIVAFTNRMETPPEELLAVCAEVVLVQRAGRHPRTSPAYRAAIRQTARKWQPAEARIEARELSEYAPEASPATIIFPD
jgi:GT2 family glycosyltransferase